MKWKIFVLIFICSMYDDAMGFEKGAPFKMCLQAYPKHHHKNAQTSESPFKITLSSDNYSPSDLITVTMEATDGTPFRGFTLSATPQNGDPEEIAGSFTKAPEAAKEFSWPFVNGETNCLTQKTNELKAKIVAEWRAPNESIGDVVFTGAIVQSFEVFWINVSSAVVSANIPATNLAYISEPSPIFDPRLSMADCGRTKGCLLWPKFCTGYECQYIVTFDSGESYVDFEMAGPASNYISLGFSHDIFMKDDETITCVSSDFGVSVQQGYNPGLHNERLRTDDLTNVQVQHEDGFFFCRFRRPVKITAAHVNDHNYPPTIENEVFDLTEQFYAMLAWGPTAPGSNTISKHVELPLVSPAKVNFRSTDIVYMSALPITIQAHAVMVFIAWIGMAGFAMVIGRHFREGFGGKMSCGVKAWFQIHRMSLTLVFLLTAASFVLIFIKFGGWNKHVTLHAAIGIVVVTLLCFQILLAMVRPDPTSSYRPAFTWVHRIAGKLNHAFAAFCMMLGVNVELLPKVLIDRETKLLAVWICAQVLWELFFEVLRWRKKAMSKGFDTTISMDDMGGSNGSIPDQKKPKSSAPSRNSILKRVALVFYMLSTAVFAALAIAFVFLV